LPWWAENELSINAIVTMELKPSTPELSYDA